MNPSPWDADAEQYLRGVMKIRGTEEGFEGVPSAFPTTIFETAWVSSALYFNKSFTNCSGDFHPYGVWLHTRKFCGSASDQNTTYSGQTQRKTVGLSVLVMIQTLIVQTSKLLTRAASSLLPGADDTARTILSLIMWICS
jgi:hypothetical protein